MCKIQGGSAKAGAAPLTPVAPPTKLSFDYSRVALADPGKQTLAGLIAWLKADPQARITVAGYFDKADAAGADLAASRVEIGRDALLDAEVACDHVAVGAPVQVGVAAACGFDRSAVKVNAAAAAAPLAMPASICFGPASAYVATAPGSTMAGLIDWMKADPTRRVSVAADTGDKARNEKLANDRAAVVHAALVAAGIGADRIDVKAPVADAGRKPGIDLRRVVINWFATRLSRPACRSSILGRIHPAAAC
jgi:outer membrane protein OmpA-like peptidoglycan-associated protein